MWPTICYVALNCQREAPGISSSNLNCGMVKSSETSMKTTSTSYAGTANSIR